MSTPQSSARAEARPDTRCPKDTLIQDDALCAMSNHLIGVYFPRGTLGARVVTGRPLRVASTNGKHTESWGWQRGLR